MGRFARAPAPFPAIRDPADPRRSSARCTVSAVIAPADPASIPLPGHDQATDLAVYWLVMGVEVTSMACRSRSTASAIRSRSTFMVSSIEAS